MNAPEKTYVHQLCEDIECSLEDLPGAMYDWEGWREKFRKLRAARVT